MMPTVNTIDAMKQLFVERLEHIRYDTVEARSLYLLALEHGTGYRSIDLLTDPKQRLSESEILQLLWVLDELEAKRPIQYILGEARFLGMQLKCDERALIPRPETEELVEMVVRENPTGGRLLDIGTGTGAIALGLSFIPDAEVHAMEVDSAAMELAQENAQALGSHVHWHLDDLFAPTRDYPLFDVIVSNPPYIEEHEQKDMDARVKEEEPHIALFVPDGDPLRFAKGVLAFAKEHLKPGGKVYLEGHKDHMQAAKQLYEELGYISVEILHDLDGHERFMKATKMITSRSDGTSGGSEDIAAPEGTRST